MNNNKLYNDELDAVIDSEEAGAILGVGAEQAKVLARAGRVVARKKGRDWRFSRSSVEDIAKIDRPVGLHLAPKNKLKKKRRNRR